MRVRRAVLSPITCLSLQCFSTLAHKRQDIRKKKGFEPKTCVFISSTTFLSLILRRLSEVSEMYIHLHVKYPLLLSDFNATRILLTKFRKILKNPSNGSRAVCMRADGQTDITKPTVVFRSFTNAPTTVVISSCEHMQTQKCAGIP
jgi:hypothetical protein